MNSKILTNIRARKTSHPILQIDHHEISQESGNTEIKITVEVADHPSATPITNMEHERAVNDERKNIKVLKKVYIEPFISEFNVLLKEKML